MRSLHAIFIITQKTNKNELYTGSSDDEFSFVELKHKVAEIFGLSHISPEEQQQEKIEPDISKLYRKLSIEKSQTGGYFIFLMGYAKS